MDASQSPLPSYPIPFSSSSSSSSAFLPLTPSNSLDIAFPSPISSVTSSPLSSSSYSSSSSPSFQPQPSPLNLPEPFYALPSVPLAPMAFLQDEASSSQSQEEHHGFSAPPSSSTSGSPISQTSRVPRPLNSFMTYRKVKQHEVIRQNPSVDNRDISRIVAQWWRSEPASVKEHYKRLADQGKREHLLKYPGYKYAPRKKGPRKATGPIPSSSRKRKSLSSPVSGEHLPSHGTSISHPTHSEYAQMEHQVLPYSLPFLSPSPTVQDDPQVLDLTQAQQLDLSGVSSSPSSYDFLLPGYLTSMLEPERNLSIPIPSAAEQQSLLSGVSPDLSSQDFFSHPSPTLTSIAAHPSPLDGQHGDTWMLQDHKPSMMSEETHIPGSDGMTEADMLNTVVPQANSPWSVLPPMAPTLLVDPSCGFDSAA